MNYYSLARFISGAYKNSIDEKRLPEGWKLFTDANKLKDTGNGFYGASFMNENTKEFVVAFSGTSFDAPIKGSLVSDLISDLDIIKGKLPAQFTKDALPFVNKTLDKLKAEYAEEFQANDIKVTFTGHSLGAVLADVCGYAVKTSKVYENVKVINFDNIGSKPLIEAYAKKIDSAVVEFEGDFMQFQSKPTLINGINSQYGKSEIVDFKPKSNLFTKVLKFVGLSKFADAIDYHYFGNWMNSAFDKDTGGFVAQPEFDYSNELAQEQELFVAADA